MLLPYNILPQKEGNTIENQAISRTNCTVFTVHVGYGKKPAAVCAQRSVSASDEPDGHIRPGRQVHPEPSPVTAGIRNGHVPGIDHFRMVQGVVVRAENPEGRPHEAVII